MFIFLLKQIECNREKKFHRSANWKNKKILKSLVLQKLQLVPSQNISYIHFRWLYYIAQINSSDKTITFKWYRNIYCFFCYLIIMPSYICFRISLNSILLRAFIFSLCCVVHCSCCIHQRALSIKYFFLFFSAILFIMFILTPLYV